MSIQKVHFFIHDDKKYSIFLILINILFAGWLRNDCANYFVDKIILIIYLYLLQFIKMFDIFEK